MTNTPTPDDKFPCECIRDPANVEQVEHCPRHGNPRWWAEEVAEKDEEIKRLRAENEKLRAALNNARAGDIPYLLGMLSAHGVDAPKFIVENQDRWREGML
jgi:hypothetical protein